MPHNSGKHGRTRLYIAQEAARIILESGKRDFYSAKYKALSNLGGEDTFPMPSNKEVEQALVEYQKIFNAHTQRQLLINLRQAALKAMKLFSPFAPRLTGAVLSGTADKNSPINLHVFTDTAEKLNLFLMQHNIPFELQERRLRYTNEYSQDHPVYCFVAGVNAIELTLFSLRGKRQIPLSIINGKSMPRATLNSVRALLEN